MCSGNGLLGMYVALYSQIEVVSMDRRQSTKYKRLKFAIERKYDLRNHRYNQVDIWDEEAEEIVEGGGWLFSIHACGQLTDRVIELGIKLRQPFAIIPCCHKRGKPYFKPKEMPNRTGNVRDYQDNVRVQYIKEQGFLVAFPEIDKKTTEYNRILIGVPT